MGYLRCSDTLLWANAAYLEGSSTLFLGASQLGLSASNKQQVYDLTKDFSIVREDPAAQRRLSS